jgi:hypothetical protein
MAEKKESFATVKARHYQATFSTLSADFVLQDLMKHCNFITSSFMGQDSHTTAYNEGKRDVCLYILGILQKNELQVKAMIESQVYDNALLSSKEGESLAQKFSDGLF